MRRKFLCILLTLTMLFASSMTVFATDYEWHLLIGTETLTDQDAITWYEDDCYGKKKLVVQGSSSGELSDFQEGTGDSVTLSVNVPAGKKWTVVGKSEQTPDAYATHLPILYI